MFKKYIIVLTAVISAVFINISCNKPASDINQKSLTDRTYTGDTANITADIQNISTGYIVYYFHPEARCQSCINIENYTREAVDDFSKKELKNCKILFREVNVDDSINEHYKKDYNLRFSTVVIAGYRNMREENWKNLEHAWKYSNDRDSFFTYINAEIKSFIKEEKYNVNN